MSHENSFTGRSRKRTTTWGTKLADRCAQVLITVGGIGTIIAVMLVGLFLFVVVAPLFSKAQIDHKQQVSMPATLGQVKQLAVDEYQSMALTIDQQGTLTVINLRDGQVLETRPMIEAGPAITAMSFSDTGDTVALGFEDGRVRVGAIGFNSEFLSEDQVTEQVRNLEPGELAIMGEGVVEVTTQGQYRYQALAVTLDDPIDTGLESKIIAIDHVERTTGPVFVVLSEQGQLRMNLTRKFRNMLTGKTTVRVNSIDLPYEPADGDLQAVKFLGVDSLAANVILAFDNGKAYRFYTQRTDNPQLAETLDLLAGKAGDKLTAIGWVIGRDTLITADDKGAVRAWFTVRDPEADAPDGRSLVVTHDFGSRQLPVTSMGPSARSRLVTMGYADGSVAAYYVTNAQQLAKVESNQQTHDPVLAVALAPKEDGLYALTASGLTRWQFDAQYPEANMASLFLPVWYAGEDAPTHAWQSSAATDAAEPKYGMIPLIFGTIKATVYALSFAVPLALLAAIYTSQFMDPKLKGRIKPVIEMMASLPSVVLGFLAGLVIAPYVENFVPTAMAAFVTIPLALIIGAFVWQMLPNSLLVRIEQWRVVPIILIALPLGLIAARTVGPAMEYVLFGGDMKQWLAFTPGEPLSDEAAATYGSSIGGWAFLLFPIIGVAMALFVSFVINPMFRRASTKWSRGTAASVNFGKILACVAATIAIALLLGLGLDVGGFDVRGDMSIWGMNLSPAGTYVQRNALIVGFAMGFAVIPIIFTIADDAMTAVPTHLISASLGAGATPWQTATRVVIPTAMSGIFSACMIGLGRAVGETMIVLMAAGNTPIMDLNIFEGFRTLSANIATELPEAVKNSTHYRTLFLSALVLFIMTFVINTFAEVIRQRFRKRAINL